MEKIVKLIKFTEGAIYVDVQGIFSFSVGVIHDIDNEVGYKGLKDFIEAKHWEALNVKRIFFFWKFFDFSIDMLNCDTRHDDRMPLLLLLML